jgi:hypothetical protein
MTWSRDNGKEKFSQLGFLMYGEMCPNMPTRNYLKNIGITPVISYVDCFPNGE